MVENNASRTISTVSTRPLLFMFGITLRCRSSGFRAEAGLSLGDVRPLPKEECSPNHVPSSLPRRRPPWRSAQWGPPASPLGGAPMGRAQEGPARRWLTAGFDLGRDQPNFIDTRCVGDVDDLCHIVEGQLGISLDEHDFFGAGLEDVVEAAFQILPRHVVLVDFERRLIAAASQYLHHNSAVVAWRLLLLVLGRLGNQRVQTFRSQRRDHHEDDEQHQQDVNHWRYVDVGSGALAGPPHCHTHKELPLLGASARAGTGCGRLFPGGSSLSLFGQQTDIIHAGGAHVVHHVHHGAVFGASVGFDKDPLVHFIGQAVLHFGGELVGGNLIGAKEDLPVTHDGHEQGIFLVRVGHGRWAIHLGHVHAHALLQHGRDDHENDEQHQHHVHHRSDVDVGIDLLAFFAHCDCHNLQPPSDWGQRKLITLSSSPANRAAFEEVVDQLAGAVVHFHVEGFHLVGEVIEHHDGRNGDEKSDSGGHQGFRNTAGDGAQAGRFLGRNLFESIENADHGTQQANEGGRRTDGGKAAQTTLQLGVNNGFSTLQSTLGSFDLLTRNVVGIAVGSELLQASDDDLRQMALLVALGDLDGFLNLAFTQGAGNRGSKSTRLLASRTECHGAIDHDANRPARHDEQNENNDLGQNPHLSPEGDWIPAHLGFLENPGGDRRYVTEAVGGKVS